MADDRPVIHMLVAREGEVCADEPRACILIDLLDWWAWKAEGFIMIAVDPEEEDAFRAWAAEHEDCA